MKLSFELTEKEVAALQAVRVAAADVAARMIDSPDLLTRELARGYRIEEGCALIDALIKLSRVSGSQA